MISPLRTLWHDLTTWHRIKDVHWNVLTDILVVAWNIYLICSQQDCTDAFKDPHTVSWSQWQKGFSATFLYQWITISYVHMAASSWKTQWSCYCFRLLLKIGFPCYHPKQHLGNTTISLLTTIMSFLLASCLSNPTSTVEVLQLELCSWANTGRRPIIMSFNKLDSPQFLSIWFWERLILKSLEQSQ